MLILIKSRRCQLDIRTWNATDPAHKTWDSFTDDFRSAYEFLHELGDLTLKNSPVLNQAQLMKSIMNAIQLDADQTEHLLDDTAPSPDQDPQEQANNTFEITLLRKFEELTAELANLAFYLGTRPKH